MYRLGIMNQRVYNLLKICSLLWLLTVTMAMAEVVEMPVPVINSPIQDYSHLADCFFCRKLVNDGVSSLYLRVFKVSS